MIHKNKRKKKTQTKWAKLTDVGRQTKFFTELFENSSLKVSFKTVNSIGNLLAQNKYISQKKFINCGVHQLTCRDCNRVYWTDWQILRIFPGFQVWKLNLQVSPTSN